MTAHGALDVRAKLLLLLQTTLTTQFVQQTRTWGTAEWRSWSMCCLNSEGPSHLMPFHPETEEPDLHQKCTICLLQFQKWCSRVSNSDIIVKPVWLLTTTDNLHEYNLKCLHCLLTTCYPEWDFPAAFVSAVCLRSGLSCSRRKGSSSALFWSIYSRCCIQIGYSFTDRAV